MEGEVLAVGLLSLQHRERGRGGAGAPVPAAAARARRAAGHAGLHRRDGQAQLAAHAETVSGVGFFLV